MQGTGTRLPVSPSTSGVRRCGVTVLLATAVLSQSALARPIPNGPDARTERDFRRDTLVWLERVTVKVPREQVAGKGRNDAALRFLDGVCSYECLQPGAPSRTTLADQAKSLIKSGERNPVVRAWCGRVLLLGDEPDKALPVLRKSLAGLRDAKYPRFHAFICGRALASILRRSDATRKEAARVFLESVDALADSVVAGEFKPREHPIAFRYLRNCERVHLIDRYERFADRLDRHKDMDPWLATTSKGFAQFESAWEYRDAVKPKLHPSEMSKMRGLLKKAADTLTKAWKMNKQRPEAAYRMIRVVMAYKKNDLAAQRKWFDRAVAAQVDYAPAYSEYVEAIRPEWGGSMKALADFGQECIDSGRFDTTVPMWYIQTVKWASFWRARQSPLSRRTDSHASVLAKVRLIYEGMLERPVWAGHRDYLLTSYALESAWYGDHEGAAGLLRRVRGNVDMRELVLRATFTWNPRMSAVLMAEISAYTGQGGDFLRQADSAHDGRAAWSLFEKAAESYKEDARVRLYVLGRMVDARLGNDPSRLPLATTGLHRAALAGNLAETRFLLEQGYPADRRDRDGLTALCCAARNGHLDVMKMLLERGADVNARSREGHTPLLSALSSKGTVNRSDAIPLLLDRGADPDAVTNAGYGTLHGAGKACDDAAILKRLLDYGLFVNAASHRSMTPLHYAAEAGNAAAVRAFLDAGADVDAMMSPGYTPLHLAACVGAPEALKLLIDKGADVNARGRNGRIPLHYASQTGGRAVANLLLQAGAKVDARDKTDHTPLMEAARFNLVDVVQLLIKRGANLNAGDNYGFSALSHACRVRVVKTAAALIKAGADIDHVDSRGWTSLHHAARFSPPELVKILLDAGADILARTRRNETPLDLARMRGKSRYAAGTMAEVVKMLEKRMEAPAEPPPDTEEDVF